MKKIKLNLVFLKYPEFYQPYISLFVEKLHLKEVLSLSFTSFKNSIKSDKEVLIIPNSRIRKIKELWYKSLNSKYKDLTYPEIMWLKKEYDIVHLQHSFLHTHVLNLLTKIEAAKRPKIVITLRGGDTYVKPWVISRWKAFYENYGHLIDAFITVSNHQKEYVTKWNVPINKVHKIPLSFGTKSMSEPKYPNVDKLKIVSAFRMCWEKNIDANIRVVKGLVDKGIPVQYDIYGDGKDVGQVYYLIDKYDLSKHVNYLGRIDNKDFKNKLPEYDFYLQLSISESAGATVIEAQSKGVPCIVSDSGGLPEMINHGFTGFNIPYYDVDSAQKHMKFLYKDKDQYFNFSKNAIEFVNTKFTLKDEVDNHLKLYKSLLN